jgi:UDP-N-acetylmuramoyl-L-alanyl-D-glutamate--2,6-diaminopimelate ligase
MISLEKLFGPIPAEIPHSLRDLGVEIGKVAVDSRGVVPGSIFFAVRGGKVDGHDFVPGLLAQGAAACVVDRAFTLPPGVLGDRVVRVSDTREALGWAMARLHGNPSHHMKMVGVTGTSGKTTTTYLIEKILEEAEHRVGVIGTINFRVGAEVIPSTHTTPGSPELQRLLADMKSKGCTAVVMEVSSHALKQHRTAGIAFDAVVFNNLSPEHLDFHPDMEDYYQSKRLLFTEYPRQAALAGKRCVQVVNIDDEFGRRLVGERAEGELLTYAIEASGASLSGARLSLGVEGIRGELEWQTGVVTRIETSLLARFNAHNLMAAACAAQAVGVAPEVIARGLGGFSQVPGRLEKVENDQGLVILVDYAHKPDALEKVLRTLHEVRSASSRIITVVGCGGDRDRTKRPVMGRLASELSDLAVITSDNPRTEDPDSIIREMVAGIPAGLMNRVRVEPDRARAIASAVTLAGPGDLILIAGKGHEDYQILGTRKIHFDDREVASEACRARSSGLKS